MRADQHLTTVTIDGRNLGVFDKVSGGGVDSEETKYRPGGMGPQISLGGSSTVDNITVSRLYVLERDHELARRLATRCGRAAAVVSKQPLDRDGNPWGRPLVWQGVLKRLAFPDGDSEATDPALLELEISTAGSIG